MELDIVDERLYGFCVESDEIENVSSAKQHKIHEAALRELLRHDQISINDLSDFVSKIEPKEYLRTRPKHLVRVGNHVPPKPRESLPRLERLLESVNTDRIHPWAAHVEYEYIHPFFNGNGRSGRALWLWMMVRFQRYDLRYNFLQRFYYQTLDRHQRGLL